MNGLIKVEDSRMPYSIPSKEPSYPVDSPMMPEQPIYTGGWGSMMSQPGPKSKTRYDQAPHLGVIPQHQSVSKWG